MQTTTISILAEIPEDLYQAFTQHLEAHVAWDQDRLFAAALSLFLLQNGECNNASADLSVRQAAQVYLDTLFEQTL